MSLAQGSCAAGTSSRENPLNKPFIDVFMTQ